MKKDTFKRIIPQRLQFPSHLKFTNADNGLLQCNGKLVQIVPSLPIQKEDNPPVDFAINGIGKYCFILSGADIILLSLANSKTQKTDCAVIQKNELLKSLENYHYDGDQLNLKLVLTQRGLHECHNAGAEAFFMGLWVNELRDFSKYLNNWLLFND